MIVHVLDEWADTTAMGVFAVRTGPALFAPTGQAASFVGQPPLVHYAGFPGDVPVWRLNEGRQERVRITDFRPAAIARTVCRRQVISV
jgi:hypothetical protein